MSLKIHSMFNSAQSHRQGVNCAKLRYSEEPLWTHSVSRKRNTLFSKQQQQQQHGLLHSIYARFKLKIPQITMTTMQTMRK